MAIEDLYNTKFDLYRNTLNTPPNSIGGFTRTASLVASNIPAYITYLSGEEQVLYGKNNIPATHRLFTSPDYEYRSTDLVYWDGDYYNILYIDNCNKMYHHLEILLQLTKAPLIVYPESSSSESSSSSSSEGYSSSSSTSSEGFSSSSSSSSGS